LASIDDVLTALDRVVDRAHADADPCGYFAVLYRTVTEAVKDELEAGSFDDAARMERLDTLFADRYLDAIEARRAGTTATASWQLTFDAAGRWRPLVLQHLLVGVNAHINLDLGIAAARCVPSDELPALRADYDRINAILATMIDGFHEALREVSPWLGLLDRVGARGPNELVRFSIVVARAGAWRFATELASTPGSRWAEAITARDRRVAAVGHRVLHPGWWASTGLLLARLREPGDVRSVLERLSAVPVPSSDRVAATLRRWPSGPASG
jgi:hypothetical protein